MPEIQVSNASRVGFTAMALVTFAIPPGCVSFSLPSALTDSQQQLVESTHFGATIGVAQYRWPVWSDRLRDALRSTGLFDRVERLGEIQNPDLVAHVRGTANHANPLPLLPAITLGVVPIITEDERGQVFSLQSSNNPFVPPDLSDGHRPPDPPERFTVRVDFRYAGTMHMGWIALLTGLLPSRSWLEPRLTSRYGNALAARICADAREIRELIRESRKTQ